MIFSFYNLLLISNTYYFHFSNKFSNNNLSSVLRFAFLLSYFPPLGTSYSNLFRFETHEAASLRQGFQSFHPLHNDTTVPPIRKSVSQTNGKAVQPG